MTDDARSSDPASDLLTPLAQRLSLRQRLGEGGLGVVYATWDANLRRTIALKVLRDGATSLEARRGLATEARITAALDHPGVLPVYELGVDHDGALLEEGALYFSMKHVEGQTLEQWMAASAGKARSARRLFEELQVYVKVCETVAFAHSRGVIHRDLKPSNIMLGRFGEVYVLDWGVAKTLDGADAEPFAGTFAYMAPEQARAEAGAVDQQSDVFSLGAILYEMLSGRPPYVLESGSGAALRFKAMMADVPDLATVASWRVPRGLARIAMRALSKDRSRRFAGAPALKEAVEEFMRSGWQFPQRQVPAGELVVRENEPGDTAFVVVSGACRAFKTVGGQKLVLRDMGEGEVFGETAVFGDRPRTASVEAIDDVTLLEISRTFFLEEEGMGFWLGRFVKALAERFSERDARAAELERRLDVERGSGIEEKTNREDGGMGG